MGSTEYVSLFWVSLPVFSVQLFLHLTCRSRSPQQALRLLAPGTWSSCWTVPSPLAPWTEPTWRWQRKLERRTSSFSAWGWKMWRLWTRRGERYNGVKTLWNNAWVRWLKHGTIGCDYRIMMETVKSVTWLSNVKSVLYCLWIGHFTCKRKIVLGGAISRIKLKGGRRKKLLDEHYTTLSEAKFLTPKVCAE